MTESGWRGSRDGWLEAAYESLIEGGIDQVKILPLATRLKLARTSFYWHFSDRAALLAALLDRWEERSSLPLIAATEAYADTEAEALLNVIGCFVAPDGFDDRLEFAVRSWALQDAEVSDRLRAADARRLRALTALFERWGHGPSEADVRARTLYLTQIGYISMRVSETVAERLARIPDYVAIYSGAARPSPREMARLRARLGLPPEA